MPTDRKVLYARTHKTSYKGKDAEQQQRKSQNSCASFLGTWIFGGSLAEGGSPLLITIAVTEGIGSGSALFEL
ncbi:10930_t:CDS:2 [Funneliformis mosseae]|uniref:10930_t:CDS:1 n=1 Tax=Funneliformis mosseae TaxID=27381 RepID=A0A9N9AKE7_FUNMO|nr:10930_t:CDS:2 [Funneliformis mosseae]